MMHANKVQNTLLEMGSTYDCKLVTNVKGMAVVSLGTVKLIPITNPTTNHTAS